MNDTHITINQIYTEMVYWWADQCDWLELIWTFGTSDLNIDWQKLLKQAIFWIWVEELVSEKINNFHQPSQY